MQTDNFLRHHGQQQLIAHLNSLPEKEQSLLINQLASLEKVLPVSFRPEKFRISSSCKPFTSPYKENSDLYNLGLDSLKSHKALLILLAGGDGSRLGFAGPKGCFPILHNKSLFQLHCEHILDLFTKTRTEHLVILLTSPLNSQATLSFFKEHHYFGIAPSNIRCVQQPLFPIIDEKLQWLLKSATEIATAPNGNGGLFQALYPHRQLLNDVSFVFILNIDNALAQSFDPMLLGSLIRYEGDMALRCIATQNSAHKVGVLAQQDNHLAILDYNDIDNAANFPYGNINTLCYSSSFFQTLLEISWPVHWVKRKTSDSLSIWKGERFITDTISYAKTPIALLSEEHKSFAPLKNPSDIDAVRKLLS